MNNPLTARQKELLEVIYRFIADTGWPPSFEDMRENLRVSSNQSIMDLLKKLSDKGFVKKEEGAARALTILPAGYRALGAAPLVPVAGTTAAGPALAIEEVLGEWETLKGVDGGDVAKFAHDTSFFRVSGDSMINANISDGDTLLIQHTEEYFSEDIVLARIGDGWTVKRFMSEDKPPYVYLKPENPEHDIMYFTDEVELQGKVLSVIKNGRFVSVK